MSDVVKRPSHYCDGRKYEPAKVCQDWGLDFCLGSAVKYISRAGRKDDIIQDLSKAIRFIELEIEWIQEERLAVFLDDTIKAGKEKRISESTGTSDMPVASDAD